MSQSTDILNSSQYTARFGSYKSVVSKAIAEAAADDMVTRLWERDHTVWQPEPTEISNRLGWLDIADRMVSEIPAIETFVESVVADGFTNVLLLGMGGSSLAPEVFQKVFGRAEGFLELDMLDSTDPGAVSFFTDKLDPKTTLYIVSSKSGGTVESVSFFKHFYRHLERSLGENTAGHHFVAITDPGSRLGELARELTFREVFENDPNIGGRFSALSHFGLVPAALLGVDLKRLLVAAIEMGNTCRLPVADNPGFQLGLAMEALASAGRDKCTLLVPPELGTFGDWVEQLIAESSGKNGKGILPVVSEEPASPDAYGSDRLFVEIGLKGAAPGGAAEVLAQAGHPGVDLQMANIYDMGAQFFLWEMATSVACARLGINAFDQPNVESAKVVARSMMDAYKETGSLPASDPVPVSAETVRRFVSEASEGDYVGVLAYLTPNQAMATSLAVLRKKVRDLTGLATVSGFGPRYLHSSGQLHKGDKGNGRFIVLTSDVRSDVPIPDTHDTDDGALSFGVLIAAQGLGDMKALRDEGRPVLHIHLGGDAEGELRGLAGSL